MNNKSGRKRTKGKEPEGKYKLWRQWRTQYHNVTEDSIMSSCDQASPLDKPCNQAVDESQPTIHGTVLCHKLDKTGSITKGALMMEDYRTLSVPQQQGSNNHHSSAGNILFKSHLVYTSSTCLRTVLGVNESSEGPVSSQRGIFPTKERKKQNFHFSIKKDLPKFNQLAGGFISQSDCR